jgi:hypothetical protein
MVEDTLFGVDWAIHRVRLAQLVFECVIFENWTEFAELEAYLSGCHEFLPDEDPCAESFSTNLALLGMVFSMSMNVQ